MYGYVKIHRPELKCRELDTYQAAYCGLCRALGRCTGQCSRLTLSYDMTFFALFRMALTGDAPTVSSRRCPIHPMKKRPMMEQNDELSFTAMTSALLLWHKLKDDRSDETGKKRARAVLAGPAAAGARRRACRMTVSSSASAADAALTGSRVDDRIRDCMQKLRALEQQEPPSVDVPAQLFGELMGDLLSFGLEGSAARLGREIGIRTGRWVYILDAADDYDEDRRRGRYNPFLCLYGADAALSDDRKTEIAAALDMETDAILRALDLISLTDRDTEGVIRNILSEGMPRTARSILFPPDVPDRAASKTQKGSKHT